jgi:hypothetical protein
VKSTEIIRLSNLYYSLKHRGERKFSKNEFIKWYKEKLSLGFYYCGLEIEKQILLIKSRKLNSNRFFTYSYTNKKGTTKFGTRGFSFEVDRRNPKGKYSVGNCVLCCYFCNNDKSDVFSSELKTLLRMPFNIYLNLIQAKKSQNENRRK